MLKIELVEEVVTTMGEAASRGLFVDERFVGDWTGRAAKEPGCPLYVYTYPMPVVTEDDVVEGPADAIRAVIYQVQGEPAIFCSVVEMLGADLRDLLGDKVKVWVK